MGAGVRQPGGAAAAGDVTLETLVEAPQDFEKRDLMRPGSLSQGLLDPLNPPGEFGIGKAG